MKRKGKFGIRNPKFEMEASNAGSDFGFRISNSFSVLSVSFWYALVVNLVPFGLVLAILLSSGCQKAGTARLNANPPPTIATKGGVEMVLIPAGSFEMGSKHGREEERPTHKVWID